MKYIKVIAFLIGCVLNWLILSFIGWNMDVSDWSWWYRGIMFLQCALTFFAIFGGNNNGIDRSDKDD